MLGMNRIALVGVVMFAVGCSKKPVTAMEVCQKLVEGGIASNCHEKTPEGLAADARREAEFDLPSVPGHGGAVFSFDKAEAYDATAKIFEDAKVLTGPHRYGNKKALIFTQINKGMSMDLGDKAKTLIESL
jgi:hypothetical protein